LTKTKEYYKVNRELKEVKKYSQGNLPKDQEVKDLSSQLEKANEDLANQQAQLTFYIKMNQKKLKMKNKKCLIATRI